MRLRRAGSSACWPARACPQPAPLLTQPCAQLPRTTTTAADSPLTPLGVPASARWKANSAGWSETGAAEGSHGNREGHK